MHQIFSDIVLTSSYYYHIAESPSFSSDIQRNVGAVRQITRVTRMELRIVHELLQLKFEFKSIRHGETK